MLRTLLFILPALVFSHYSLTWPPNRAQGGMKHAGACMGDDPDLPGANGTCLWFNDICFIGCDYCDLNATSYRTSRGCDPAKGQPFDRILPDEFRTFTNMSNILPPDTPGGEIQDYYDLYKHNPWFWPGKAPVHSSCGVAGGSPGEFRQEYPGDGSYPPVGVMGGMDGRFMPKNDPIEWKRGELVEVAHSYNSNHGGGYSVRLCKTPGEFEYLTEECFAAGGMKFHNESSWYQPGEDRDARVELKSKRLWVDGVQWTASQIPACGGFTGGSARGESHVDGQLQGGEQCREEQTQFPTPIEGLWGFGPTQCVLPGLSLYYPSCCKIYPGTESDEGGWLHVMNTYFGDEQCSEETFSALKELWNFNIVDLMEVPEDLEAGDYVMSFRWDCEQSSQIWAFCADIKIV